MTLNVLYVLPPTHIFAGIERVIDEVCNRLAESHGECIHPHVLFLHQYPNLDLSTRHYTSIVKEAKGRLDILKKIRETVASKKFDLVIVPQVEATVITWIACLGLNAKIALYLHGNTRFEETHPKARLLFGVMRHLVLPRLTAVFGVAPSQLAAFQKDEPSSIPHVWLPNPVRRFDPLLTPAAKIAGIVTFVNVGRLDFQKGQDRLVEAFALVHAKRPATRLRLVGYGADEGALRAQIGRLDLREAVTIENYPHDPSPVLSTGDIFVSASRWEGWSLAICEALRFGLPIVSTNCDFGPSDILTNERLGRLVPADNVAALANGMLASHDELEVLKSFADYRRQYVERFDVENVCREHEAALLRVVGLSTAQNAPVTAEEPLRL